MKPKIFGIGLSRTGTTSLTRALQILGYRTIHLPEKLEMVEKFDGATDQTVAIDYKLLDEQYPGSKFILTVRDLQSWMRSVGRQMSRPIKRESFVMKLRMRVYGVDAFDEDRVKTVYEGHIRQVRDHFKSRPGDLLVMDICNGDGWDRLCPFLGKSKPKPAFPHLNSRMK